MTTAITSSCFKENNVANDRNSRSSGMRCKSKTCVGSTATRRGLRRMKCSHQLDRSSMRRRHRKRASSTDALLGSLPSVSFESLSLTDDDDDEHEHDLAMFGFDDQQERRRTSFGENHSNAMLSGSSTESSISSATSSGTSQSVEECQVASSSGDDAFAWGFFIDL